MRIINLSAFLGILLFLNACSGLLFYPSGETFVDPEKYGLSPEAVDFQSNDGTPLTGWFFKSRTKPVRGTVIQFHGNAENMTSHFQSLIWLISHGYHFLAFDYRGYGASKGKPSIPGLNQDALAAYQYILEKPESRGKPIILYGQSLGGIILLKALEKFPEQSRISHVIVEGSFLSFQEIARQKMDDIWLTWPFQHLAYLLFSDDYAAVTAVTTVSPIPLLVIHGEQDPIIPFRFGQEIYETAREPKTIWPVKDGQHIDAMVWHKGKYQKMLVDYLRSH